jgi:hypothetical protein
MAKACAYHLVLGKAHRKFSPGPYRACITATQAERLFGTSAPPKQLGCGTFACVYEHADPDKVVKITRDASDVAGLIKGQGLQVPKLYDAHKLSSPAEWVQPRKPRLVTGTDGKPLQQTWPEKPEAHALVLERLKPLTGREKRLWNERLAHMRRFLSIEADAAAVTTPAQPGGVPGRPTTTIGEMVKAVCPHAGAEAFKCEVRLRELNKISADLAMRGIDWADIHAGNIGVAANGRWKALDLGATSTKLDAELPELAGTRRRRARR